MIKRIFIFTASAVAAAVFYGNVCAQENAEYFKGYGYNFAIKPFVEKNIVFFGVTYENKDENRTYMPHNPFNAGVDILWKDLSVSFGYKTASDKASMDNVDFQFDYYRKKVVFSAFAQRYKGFYSQEDKTANHPYMELTRFGLFGNYIFNNDAFSSKAAFIQSEKQLKSAGSFQLGGGIYYNKAKDDYAFDAEEMFVRNRQEIAVWQVGFYIGYGYTYVIKQNYSVTGSLLAGLNAGLVTLNGGNFETNILPCAVPRVCMGYNNDSWGINLVFLANISYIAKINDYTISFGSGKVNLSFIKRFGSKAIN